MKEPWLIYCPSIRHVQRSYADWVDAKEYCDDLNRASSVKEWVIVDARIILEYTQENEDVGETLIARTVP